MKELIARFDQVFPKTFFNSLSSFLENVILGHEWVDRIHVFL